MPVDPIIVTGFEGDLLDQFANKLRHVEQSFRIDFVQTVQWFETGNNLRLADTAAARECRTLLEAVPELIDTAVIPFDFKKSETAQLVAACEFVLEGLYAQNKISRNEEGGYTAVTKARKDRRGMIYDDLTETGKYS